jgi:hypothetical protein
MVTYFLRPLSDYCKTKTPGKWISNAPFFNDDTSSCLSATAYGFWWEKTLRETPALNLLIPQDGIGVKHATFTTVSTYFQALKNACDNTQRVLWSDLELFDIEDNPAPISRISTQIAIEDQYVRGFVSWDYIYCLSPNTGPAYSKLYFDYQAYLTGIVSPVKVSIAFNKPYAITPPPSSSYPDTTGTKLTDGQFPNGLSTQVGWANLTTLPVINLDLGTIKSHITEIRGYCLTDTTAGVYAPQYLIVSTSNNGTKYRYIGKATCNNPKNGIVSIYRWMGNKIQGRYLKIVIVPQDKEWTMINEIEVY